MLKNLRETENQFVVSKKAGASLRARDRRRFDIFPLVLLAIPVLALTGDMSLMFNFPGYLDAWIYYSFFRNLASLKQLIPSTYYGSRLSFILPGYLVNEVFQPLMANYVFHLIVWYCAVVSLYIIIKHIADRRTALLAAIIFGFYPYLWKSTGWDYPDGAGIAYYFLTAALLTLASRGSPSRLRLTLAGASCAAAFYCNPIWLFFMPSCVIMWLVLRKADGSPFCLKRLLVWSVFGAGSLTLVLAIVNHHLEGAYWFYRPSIHYAFQSVRIPNPWKAKDPAWIWRAQWLLLPVVALLVGLFAILQYRVNRSCLQRKIAPIFYANLLFVAGILGAWEFQGSAMLETFYYASYLMPFVFLFFGAHFFLVPVGLSTATFAKLMGCVFASLTFLWWDTEGHVWRWLSAFGWGPPVAFAAMALLIRATRPADTKTLVSALLGFGVLVFSSRAPGNRLFLYPANQAKDSFLRIVASMEACERMRQGRPIRFWYDQKEQNGREFASINSTYLYGFTRLGWEFPAIPDNLTSQLLTSDEALIVVLSSLPGAATRARQALESSGYHVELLGDKLIAGGDARYTLVFLKLRQDPEVQRKRSANGYILNGDLEAGTAQWAGEGVTLRAVSGGQSGQYLELQAQQGRSQYAMQWNVAKLKLGARYRFSFWVKAGSSGNEPFQAGLWDAKSQRWIGCQEGRSITHWTHYAIEFTNMPTNPLSCELEKYSATKGSMFFDIVRLSA